MTENSRQLTLEIASSSTSYWLDQCPSAAAIHSMYQGNSFARAGNRPALLWVNEGELPIPVYGLDEGPGAAAICAAVDFAAQQQSMIGIKVDQLVLRRQYRLRQQVRFPGAAAILTRIQIAGKVFGWIIIVETPHQHPDGISGKQVGLVRLAVFVLIKKVTGIRRRWKLAALPAVPTVGGNRVLRR